MNWEDLKGDWSSGEHGSQWENLSKDDFKQIACKREELSGRLQRQFGHTKEEAERQIEAFTKGIKGKQ